MCFVLTHQIDSDVYVYRRAYTCISFVIDHQERIYKHVHKCQSVFIKWRNRSFIQCTYNNKVCLTVSCLKQTSIVYYDSFFFSLYYLVVKYKAQQ